MRRFGTKALVLVAGGSIAIAILVPVFRVARDPYGAVLRHEIEAWPIDKPPRSPYSDAYHKDFARLINQIARRSSWDEQDEAWMVELIGDGWTSDEQPPEWGIDQTLYETYSLYDMALSIATDRIGQEFPIPRQVEAATRRAVEHDLQSPFWQVRHSAVANVASAHWVNEPAFRAVLEQLAEADPDERVRRNALRRLRFADGLGSGDKNGACPTCPGKGGS